MSAPVNPPQAGEAPDWAQVYLDAQAIEREAPGTVCLTEVHYVRDHRHPIPYRLGFCHYYRQSNEHYHKSWKDMQRCGK